MTSGRDLSHMQLTAVDFQQTKDKTKRSPSPSCPIWAKTQLTNIQPQREHGQVMVTWDP